MPSSRESKGNGEGPLLKTWRQEGPSGTRAKWWLITRRVTVMLVALALLGWLAYLIISPILLPRTYFAYLCADEIQILAAPPIDFPYEDFAGFANLESALSPLTRDSPPLLYGRLASPELLDAELDGLRETKIRDRDALILCIVTHGVVRDGKAYLMCSNFDPTASEEEQHEGLYEVSKLLERVRDLPGASKLLLLDAGRNDYAPRLGMAVHAFAATLKREVEAEDLPSVWVLSGNSTGERSHVSPALRRSVFSYMSSTGLQGAADLDDDGVIHLHELVDFVRFHVSQWVKESTGNRETQTPILIGSPLSSDPPHLLFTASLPEIKSVGSAINAAEETDSGESAVAKAAEFLSARVSEFGVAPLTSVAEGISGMVAGDGEKADSAGGDPSEKRPDNQAARDSGRLKGELSRLEQAWKLTAALADDPLHPVEYAPHLWRLHLDRLLWLESLQYSGELELVVQRKMADELRSMNQSLADFGKPDRPPPRDAKTAIDRIRQRRPAAPFLVEQAPTLALAELAAAVDLRQSLPAELELFAAKYDKWLSSRDGYDQFDAIAGELGNNAWRRFDEFQLLDDLRALPDTPPEMVKLALAVRRLGERVTADLLWGRGWAAATVQQADLLRLEAERLLLDQAASNWSQRCGQNLLRARRLYLDAQRQLLAVRQAIRLQHELQSRARDFLRWRRHDAGDRISKAPSAKELRELFGELSQLQTVLDRPERAELADIEAYIQRLQSIRDNLQEGLSPDIIAGLINKEDYDAGDAQRVEALLRTALLAPHDRAQCRDARVAAERQLMRRFEMSGPSLLFDPTPGDRSKESEAALALSLEWALLERFYPEPIGSSDDEEELVTRSEELGAQLAALPNIIETMAAKDAYLANPVERPHRLLQLRRAAGGLFLIDAADAKTRRADAPNNAQAGDPLRALDRAAWYDLLIAARERRFRALPDARQSTSGDAPSEYDVLLEQAARLGELAAAIPDQPLIAEHQPPGLSLEIMQTGVELVTVDEALVDLTVTSAMERETPVWMIAQYDERIIDVAGVDSKIFAEHRIPPAPTGNAPSVETRYPYRPEASGLPATFSLPARQTRRLGVRVKRLSGGGGRATLVLKAVGRSDYVRRQIPLQLPGRDELEVSIFAGKRIRRSTDDGWRLFPNRVQDLTLQIANKGGTPKSLVADFYAPREAAASRPAGVIPVGAIDTAAAARLLERFGDRELVASGATLEIPPGTSRQLVFDFRSTENRSPLSAKSADEPPRIPLPHGLLLVLEDQVTKEKTIRWLQFKVWKPRNYLTARAKYDPGGPRLTVTVEADVDQELPPGGVQVRLAVDAAYVSSAGPRSVDDEISRSRYQGDLYVPLRSESWPLEGYLPAYVHVDEYPRAFEFRVTRTNALRDLRPSSNLSSIRIVTPSRGQVFPASPVVQARLQIDVPEGFFDESGSVVEIGVDKDLDREFRDEAPRLLRSDRHVEIFARKPTGEGTTLALESRVSDFDLNLRTVGTLGPVNILGQIRSAGDVEKEYVEIVLDGDGPTFGPISLRQKGTELIATIPMEDQTETASVQAVFDLPGIAEPKWEDCQPAAGGQWEIKLSTSEIPAGTQTVLFKAADIVGNESEIRRELVTIQPPPKTGPRGEPQQPKSVKNRLWGRVVYGRRRVSKIAVTLSGAGAPTNSPTIREDGRFDFGMVPPGTYTLQARGLAGGNFHKREMQVTVSDQPNSPTRLEVEIR